MADHPQPPEQDAHWRTAGDRIQTLLDAASVGGVAAGERAEQLVGEVVGFYGAGLARIIATLGDTCGAEILDQLAADDLVASLLLVHGLHPHDVQRRIADALESVRPYLGSHGGDVHLLDVVADTARLQFSGSCKSCPSSAVTLELTVEDAVRAAAPEISTIEVLASSATEPQSSTGLIPAQSLLTKIHSTPGAAVTWHPLPDLAELAPGEVGGFHIADTTVLACRINDQLYTYRDHCPTCEQSLAGAALHRTLGPSKDPVLRCPHCHAHYDVIHAGAGLDHHTNHHLDPIPLLTRDGILSIALPAQPIGAPA